jgi:hypothetical protein
MIGFLVPWQRPQGTRWATWCITAGSAINIGFNITIIAALFKVTFGRVSPGRWLARPQEVAHVYRTAMAV